MAQFGRALRSGRRGRWFESSRIDYKKAGTAGACFFVIYTVEIESAVSAGANAGEAAGSVATIEAEIKRDLPGRIIVDWFLKNVYLIFEKRYNKYIKNVLCK